MLPRSLWWLIGVNLLPLIGVAFLGWDLGQILLLFWAESGVVGLYAAVRIVRSGGGALVLFFLVHFGGFMGGHLVFLLALFEASLADLWTPATLLVIAGLLVSHGYSFVTNFLPRADFAVAQKEMFRPYGRIVVMHLTIIAGAGLVFWLGPTVGPLMLLIVLKTAVDGIAHVRSKKPAEGA